VRTQLSQSHLENKQTNKQSLFICLFVCLFIGFGFGFGFGSEELQGFMAFARTAEMRNRR